MIEKLQTPGPGSILELAMRRRVLGKDTLRLLPIWANSTWERHLTSNSYWAKQSPGRGWPA